MYSNIKLILLNQFTQNQTFSPQLQTSIDYYQPWTGPDGLNIKLKHGMKVSVSGNKD
jgi:hypothetical protein